ncbi:MAG: YebC/PmpR family DNA-binding transcriptional regulator [Clostridia bacterium]
MSGHSKWKNIINKKNKMDSLRGKDFTKMGRELVIAVKSGGPDPSINARLADVIAKCKAINMPNDNIKRSIEKASGTQDAANYEEIVYEGYGPEGIAVMVEAATDNKNRTAGEVRHIFDKSGGNLGSTGCVSFLFAKKGVLVIERLPDSDEDLLMMQAIDAGAEDVVAEDEYFEVTTSVESFSRVRETLEDAGFVFAEAELEWVPSTYNALSDPTSQKKLERLIDALEENDDVQHVWHNWEQI